MHNSVSVLENQTYEILWDFEIQTNQIVMIIKNKRMQKIRVKNERMTLHD